MTGFPLGGTLCERGVFQRRRGRNKKRPLGATTVEELEKIQKDTLAGVKRQGQSDLALELFERDVRSGL